MEPKAKTLQERFGFSDPDLKRPEHDEIMVWLDRNILDVARGLFPASRPAIEQAESKAREYLTGRIDKLKKKVEDYGVSCENKIATLSEQLTNWPGLGPPPPRPVDKVGDKTWERPIKNGSYIIGFIDLYAIYVRPSLRLEYPDTVNGVPAWEWNTRSYYLHFEIKTEIRSIGELIRQINTYRTYEDCATFVVVSPDDKAKDILKDQKIRFVKYDPALYLEEKP